MEVSKKRAYYVAHREEYIKKAGERVKKTRTFILNLLGDKCSKCGFSDVRALQIDHVNGGGTAERKKITAGYSYYANIIKSILEGKKEYQLLCANCNWIKRYENGEFKGGKRYK